MPSPTKAPPLLIDFPTAMQAVKDGKRVTKREWDDPSTWCELRGQWLMIRISGVWNAWSVSDGDVLGEDWYVLD